jgi:hypothetical protein
MDRADAVKELGDVFKILSGDLDTVLAHAIKQDDQYARRTLYRTYFSFVEGLAFQLRQVTLASLAQTDVLTTAELALLREERFQLNSKGLPESRENFQSFLPNLLFSIRCYVKNHGAEFVPDTGHAGWEAMQRAVRIRDRLTHPRSSNGLDVSDEDKATLIKGADWWKVTLVTMFEACDEADRRIKDSLERKK